MKIEITQEVVFGGKKKEQKYDIRVRTSRDSAYERDLSPEKTIEALNELIETATTARDALQQQLITDGSESEKKGFFLRR